jgi:hypothetical protein
LVNSKQQPLLLPWSIASAVGQGSRRASSRTTALRLFMASSSVLPATSRKTSAWRIALRYEAIVLSARFRARR